MPLTVPPQVRVIYAECNTPGAALIAETTLLWDTFYDIDGNAVTGDDLAALLSILGLSYDAGAFSAVGRVVLGVDFAASVNASTGGADLVRLVTPGSDFNPTAWVPASNTLTELYLHKTFAMQPADDPFTVITKGTNNTDTPISYAVMSINRLV